MSEDSPVTDLPVANPVTAAPDEHRAAIPVSGDSAPEQQAHEQHPSARVKTIGGLVTKPLIWFNRARKSAEDYAGRHVEEPLPEDERLPMLPTIEQLRARFGHQEELSEDESWSLLNLVSGYAEGGFNGYDGLGSFVRHANSLALFGLTIEHERDSGDNSVWADEAGRSHLRLDPSSLEDGSEYLARSTEIAWRSPADAKLLNHLNTYAHEYGHLIGTSIAQNLKLDRYNSKEFHRAYLSDRPMEGMTGVFESDPQIHDERFANAMATVVVEAVMKGMEYGVDDISKLLHIAQGLDYEHGTYGIKQIDAVMLAREKNISIGTASVETGGEAAYIQGMPHPDLKYEGGLGYRSPLTPQEAANVLRFAEEHLLAKKTPPVLTSQMYREAFDAYHGGGLHPELQKRLAERQAQV